MKRTLYTLLLILSIAFPQVLPATMTDYCSAPPYVTVNVPPNIMVLMDNSIDMEQSAYAGAYDPLTNYEGYYDSTLAYTYSTSRWVPDASSVYSGNLLNWATTSSYDLLQKVLVGGLSTSRQTNVNTLVSHSSSWTKTYAGCEFSVTGGSLQISDVTAGSCSLRDATPAAPVAGITVPTGGEADEFFASTESLSDKDYFTQVIVGGRKLADTLFDLLIPDAYAGKPLRITTRSLPDAFELAPYYALIEAEGGTAAYSWSGVGFIPAGISLVIASPLTIEVSGTPALGTSSSALNPFTFTLTVSDSLGATSSRSFTLDIGTSVLRPSPNYNVRVCVGDYIQNCTNAPAGTILKSGIVDDFWGQARFGLEDFNQVATDINPNIGQCIPANPKESFLTGIENATGVGDATHFTPLVDGVYNLIDYYKNNTSASCNPFDNGAVPCTKSYILMITGGQGADVPAPADSPQVFADATNCGDSSYSNLEKNTCYGYNNDMRSTVSGVAETTTQRVSTFIVDTLGTNASLLQDAATAGGGEYYDGTVPGTLRDTLTNAFNDILDRAASGTAVSVLTTSSRGIGSMVQAYFLPTKPEGTREVSWTGYVQNLWIDPQDNLREDSVNDYELALDEDKVLRLYFDENNNETKAGLFSTDVDGKGLSCAASGIQIKDFAEVNYLWEAGTQLALTNPDARSLFTAKNVIGSAGTTTIADNQFDLTDVPASTVLTAALDADASITTENIVRYVRGECLETGQTGNTACGSTPSANYRDRRVEVTGGGANGNVWKLGDVISSTPKVLANTPANTYHIDYGDVSYYNYITSSGTAGAYNDYKARSATAFVGANDGMLHAFKVGYLKDSGLAAGIKGKFQNSSSDTGTTNLGSEAWGYIPFNAFPYLKYLADPDYCHLYYNDLSVRLADASIGCDSRDSASSSCDDPTETRVTNSWKTILIGGMRFGGGCGGVGATPAPPAGPLGAGVATGYSAYYALDITDPENPLPLWEFSDVDLGYATSYPAIIRTGPKTENGNWYAVFGSGSTQLPKSLTDVARNRSGYLYIVNLKTGALVQKIPIDHNGIIGDVMGIDEDKDYYSEAVYFGTAYDSSGWKGKLVRIDIPNQDLSTWSVPANHAINIFSGDFPFTASPDLARDADGNRWVYAGSGKYYSDVDEADSSSQRLFGFKDSTSTTYVDSDLTDQTSVTTTGTVTETAMECIYDAGTGGFLDTEIVTSITPTSAPVATPAVGWRLTLSSGERVITRPLAVGGLVDFLTYKPSSDPCSYGGESYLYALDYTTGVAPTNMAIRSTASTGGATSGTVTVANKVLLGPGAPPTGDAIIIPPPKEGQDRLKKKIQVATGVIVEAENKPIISVVSKIVHWLNK